ncbi:hypothetical protein EVG20_g3575 [Dentipellis fragilis]|uniref:Uncharacterized protein n=1 Tax=Dentipellis fragilis TaxID=205917 RepID=A0A4Y9Z0P3_9AGAM|nr:hypothetical protein EVG20_g3575 [Dentipellis fragilis]
MTRPPALQWLLLQLKLRVAGAFLRFNLGHDQKRPHRLLTPTTSAPLAHPRALPLSCALCRAPSVAPCPLLHPARPRAHAFARPLSRAPVSSPSRASWPLAASRATLSCCPLSSPFRAPPALSTSLARRPPSRPPSRAALSRATASRAAHSRALSCRQLSCPLALPAASVRRSGNVRRACFPLPSFLFSSSHLLPILSLGAAVPAFLSRALVFGPSVHRVWSGQAQPLSS